MRLLHLTNFKLAASIVVCALVLATGCTPRNEAPPPDSTELRVVVDESGRRITIPAKIERFISLAPNLTEIAFAIGAGDRMVGNTTFCNYPEQARNVTKIGDTLQPSIERVLALKPQLVLVSTASQLQTFATQLDEHGIALYITDPNDLEDVLRTITNFGDLLNETTKASNLVQQLRSRTESIESAVAGRPRLRVFFQLSGQPLYTAGKTSFVTNLIERAGGQSVTADINEAWPRLSNEAALASLPEAVIMLSGESMGASANLKVAPALQNSPAVRTGRLYVIDGDLLTRPGPRLVDGLEQIARALHPDAFVE